MTLAATHPDEVLAWMRCTLPSAQHERVLRWLEAPNHHLVRRGDASYSSVLNQIDNPPEYLYAIGDIALLKAPSLGIVGSRNATAQGLRDAQAFAHALSDEGLTIVSGLALGIDAAAHRGALAGASSTIAVMATGANAVYPKRNAALAEAIAESGLLITEFPLGSAPLPGQFLHRNRVISGLSLGVLVVEAASQSGSLSTATHAGTQGREVFALPGSIHSPLSRGCHRLIREGAKLVECAADILEELAGVRGTPIKAAAQRVDARTQTFLEAMGHAPQSIDEITERTGHSVADVSARLMQLEIDGLVAGLAGGRFQRLAGRVIE